MCTRNLSQKIYPLKMFIKFYNNIWENHRIKPSFLEKCFISMNLLFFLSKYDAESDFQMRKHLIRYLFIEKYTWNIWNFPAYVLSRIFMVLWLVFKSFMHLEFIFVYGVSKLVVEFHFLHVAVQISKHYFSKRLFLLHFMLLPPLMNINWP